MQRLFIIGNYGVRNFGDDAMLAVLTSYLKRHFHITVFSVMNSRSVKQAFGVASVSLFRPARFLIEMAKAHFVLIGGGSLIKNTSMLKLLPIFLVSLLLRKRYVFFGAEVHKLNLPLRAVFAALCKRSVLVCTRNGLEFRQRWPGPPHKDMPDLAYALPNIMPIIRKNFGLDTHNVVGVNVRPSTLTDRFDSKSWRSRIAESLEELSPREILFFPFQPCDLKEIVKLAWLMRQRGFQGRLKLVNPGSFNDALNHLRRVSLAIGMRLHFLVFASILGIPAIAIPYHEKVVRFANSVQAPIIFSKHSFPNSLDTTSVSKRSHEVARRFEELIHVLTAGELATFEVQSPLPVIQ